MNLIILPIFITETNQHNPFSQLITGKYSITHGTQMKQHQLALAQ